MGMGANKRAVIARRAAKEIENGMVVNLGIGIPTMVADFMPPTVHAILHGENGILGYGETPQIGNEDPNLCNAGGLPVTLTEGASFFDSTIAFGMIRNSYVDMTILGALQVGENGDLANWMVPGKRVPGIGGAMDLAQKAKRVIVVMEHLDKYSMPKIVRDCTLPLTARKAVNLIITDKAVIEVLENGLVLKEVAHGTTPSEVISMTDAALAIDEEIVQF